MEAFNLTKFLFELLLNILANILADKTGKAVNSGRQALLNHLQGENPTGKEELEKALKRSFLSALQTIALDSHQQLRGVHLIKYRGQPVYPPEHQQDLQWLDSKIKQLAVELKQIEGMAAVQTPLISLGEMELLVNPTNQLSEEHLQVVTEKLLAEALKDDYLPELYAAKARKDLFQQVCDHFASEIKHNPEVRSLFDTYLLTQINANMVEQRLKIQDLETLLRSSDSSRSHNNTEARWNVKLDIDIEELETVPLS